MTILAGTALALTVVSLLVIGGVFFAPFLFGLFLLALIGVIAGSEDRTVRHHPSMSPEVARWLVTVASTRHPGRLEIERS